MLNAPILDSMTLAQSVSQVRTQGFEIRSQVPHFERDDDYACYLYRRRDRFHEYALLVSYDNVFLECVFERYLAPKDTRRPKGRDVQKKGDPYTEFQYRGFAPIYATILRGDTILLDETTQSI